MQLTRAQRIQGAPGASALTGDGSTSCVAVVAFVGELGAHGVRSRGPRPRSVWNRSWVCTRDDIC